MKTTVTLDAQHYKAAADTARELGTTPERFIHSLIDAATLGFDEILAPVRDAFAMNGVTADELDDSVTEARRTIYARSLQGRS
ncbi:MAG TPA: hypothetical protein VFC78_05005 [Tepidisphaeraceae bacterium]|nr:hypothetical protein [Tepidisphaeraceae bacterium]